MQTKTYMHNHLSELIIAIKCAFMITLVWMLDSIYLGFVWMVSLLQGSFVSKEVIDFLYDIRFLVTTGTTLLIFIIYFVKLIKEIRGGKKNGDSKEENK